MNFENDVVYMSDDLNEVFSHADAYCEQHLAEVFFAIKEELEND